MNIVFKFVAERNKGARQHARHSLSILAGGVGGSGHAGDDGGGNIDRAGVFRLKPIQLECDRGRKKEEGNCCTRYSMDEKPHY